MDNLLLLYIATLLVAAFVGMSLVLRILRSLPFMGMGYPTSIPANTSNKNSNGSSGFSTTLLILIACAILFWLLFSKTIEQSTVPIFPPIQDSTFHSQVNEHGLSIQYKESSVVNNRNVRCVNLSPEKTLPLTYAIQLAAISNENKAQMLLHKLRKHTPVLYLDSDGLYKILISGFTSREHARIYQEQSGVDGFIREV